LPSSLKIKAFELRVDMSVEDNRHGALWDVWFSEPTEAYELDARIENAGAITDTAGVAPTKAFACLALRNVQARSECQTERKQTVARENHRLLMRQIAVSRQTEEARKN